MSNQFEDFELDANSGSGPRELPPKGLHKAVCVDVVDLGYEKNLFYDPAKEGSKEQVRRVKFVFEIGAKRTNGEQFNVSKTYSASLYDGKRGGKASGLYSDLTSWSGHPVDSFKASEYLGKAAQLYIKLEPKKNDPSQLTAKIAAIEPDDDMTVYQASGKYKRWIPKQQNNALSEEVGF